MSNSRFERAERFIKGTLIRTQQDFDGEHLRLLRLTKDWIDSGLRSGTSPFVGSSTVFDPPTEFPGYKEILKRYGVTDPPPTISFYPTSLDQSPDVIPMSESPESKPDSVIPKGILPNVIEDYLESVARFFATDYSAVFSAFLGCASFAMSGNKTIRINKDWLDKGLLWIVLIGPSGSGKTHIMKRAGGQLLDKHQAGLADIHKLALNRYRQEQADRSRDRNTQSEPPPVRKRIYEQHLTLEKLFSLHCQNPEGLGVLSDELSSVLDGLGQYKNKGSSADKSKWLELFNGSSFSNPTFQDGDRYLASSFVPILGGLQPGLLSKLINDTSEIDGYAARFLYSHMEMKDPMKANVRHFEATSIPTEMEELFKNILSGRGALKVYEISMSAKTYLHTEEDRLIKQQQAAPNELYAVYAKLITYLYRLTLVLHVLRDGTEDEVNEETAEYAIKVLQYFEHGSLQAFQQVVISKEEKLKKEILDKVKRLGSQATREKLSNNFRRRFKNSVRDAGLFIDGMLEEGMLIITKHNGVSVLCLP